MEVSTGLECEVHRVKPGRGYYLLDDWVSQKGASDGREHAPGSAPSWPTTRSSGLPVTRPAGPCVTAARQPRSSLGWRAARRVSACR